MVQNPDRDVSSEDADGRRVIVDYADIERAKREIAAAAGTHCNSLQHTAAHCSTLQHTAAHCNTLQHTATHCNTLQ